MKCFIGLGNPEEKYSHNRHNAGFLFVDYVYKTLGHFPEWKHDYYLKSFITKSTGGKEEYILVKPQTFMNLSGIAVQAVIKRFSIQVDKDLYIAHDDLDIPLGKFKIQQEGPPLHNGISSIEQTLKTKDFWRIRIGIENRQGVKIPGEAYVLDNFKSGEIAVIEEINQTILQKLSA